MNKYTLCDSIAQQRDVGSALYLQNKDSNKIAMARRESREEGIAEGLEKGKLEKEKQIVLNMKDQGLENEFIAKCLNIGIMELQQLLNN